MRYRLLFILVLVTACVVVASDLAARSRPPASLSPMAVASVASISSSPLSRPSLCRVTPWPRPESSPGSRGACVALSREPRWWWAVPARVTLGGSLRDNGGSGLYWGVDAAAPTQRRQFSRGGEVAVRLHWDLGARRRGAIARQAAALRALRTLERLWERASAAARRYGAAASDAERANPGSPRCAAARWRAWAAARHWLALQRLMAQARCVSRGQLGPSSSRAPPPGEPRSAARGSQR